MKPRTVLICDDITPAMAAKFHEQHNEQLKLALEKAGHEVFFFDGRKDKVPDADIQSCAQRIARRVADKNVRGIVMDIWWKNFGDHDKVFGFLLLDCLYDQQLISRRSEDMKVVVRSHYVSDADTQKQLSRHPIAGIFNTSVTEENIKKIVDVFAD